MAVLAGFSRCAHGMTLPDFLEKKVFASSEKTTEVPDAKMKSGFDTFLERYMKCAAADSAVGQVLTKGEIDA